MKKFLVLLTVIICYGSYSGAQTKHALIVAIGKYPEESNFKQISSGNDVPLIKNALLKQDFKESDINILKDEQATKVAIVKAIDALIESSKAGDIVVIHFSSHGEQIEDDNEDETDGLDECIVPFDAVFSHNEAEFKKLAPAFFRDDEFGDKVILLRNKLGKSGDLLVILDACHSASGTRGGTEKVRGNQSPMVSKNFDRNKLNGKDNSGVFKENTKVRLKNDAATYVIISGAQAQELNSECRDDRGIPVGSLSYALSKTLSTMDGNVTYRNLFAQVEDVMRGKAPKQKPAIEGDGLDRELFGGNYKRQQPYFEVNLEKSSNDTITLNGGAVSGVAVGSVINFFPGGTDDPAGKTPIQKGTVIKADNFESVVKLDTKNEELLKNKPWAFISEMSYGKNKIILSVDSLANEIQQKVKDRLKDLKLVEFNAKSDLYLGKPPVGDGLALMFPGTGTVFTDGLDVNNPVGIADALKRFDRYRYLRNLSFTDKSLSAKIELIYLDEKGAIDSNKIKERTKFGRLEVKEDDVLYLRITNTGAKDFYINIVDMQPDGKINPIVPNKKEGVFVDACKVAAGKNAGNLETMQIIIGPPYGEETFKVFLSATILDLEEILTTNTDTNNKTRGVLNNLATIFKESDSNALGTRGGKVKVDQNGTIFSLNFSILSK
jgi:hypothetical protein